MARRVLGDQLREQFWLGLVVRQDGAVGSAPAHTAGDRVRILSRREYLTEGNANQINQITLFHPLRKSSMVSHRPVNHGYNLLFSELSS